MREFRTFVAFFCASTTENESPGQCGPLVLQGGRSLRSSRGSCASQKSVECFRAQPPASRSVEEYPTSPKRM